MSPIDSVTAMMPGRILSVKVKEGQRVEAGTVLCILEAMKMHNEVRAAKDGVVGDIKVTEGVIVYSGEILMQLR